MKQIALLLILPLAAFGQEPESAAAAKDTARSEALLRVKALAESYSQLDDQALAVRSLAVLGGLTCPYDAPTARGVFEQAAGLLPYVDDELRERRRGALLATAAGCDPDFAKKLREATKPADDNPDTATSDLRTARSLLADDPTRASELLDTVANRAPGLDYAQASFLVELLHRLREQDVATADRLYLQALAQLRANPAGGSEALFALGNYLFTIPRILEQEGNRRYARAVTFINQVRVYYFSTERPDRPVGLRRAYLETAALVFQFPTTDRAELTRRYALAYQILPLTPAAAPELMPAFQELLQRLAPSLPERATGVEVPQRLAPEGQRERKSAAEELEEETDPSRREALHLMVAYQHWQKKDFAGLRATAAKMDDRIAEEQLLRLADFGEARKALAGGDVRGAKTLADAMPGSAERALLYLGITAALKKNGANEDAVLVLRLAEADTRKLHASLRPNLRLAIAAIDQDLDEEAALANLQLAVSAFNESDFETEEQRSDRYKTVHGYDIPTNGVVARGYGGYTIIVSTERTWRHFHLEVPGVEAYTLPQALPAFEDSDPDRVEAIISGLLSEERRTDAQAYSIELRLKRAFGESE